MAKMEVPVYGMKGLVVNKLVEVRFTADQYELFTTSKDCTEAAAALNKIIETTVNGNMTRREAYDSISRVQAHYADYGAYDTEPSSLIRGILDTIYREEE